MDVRLSLRGLTPPQQRLIASRKRFTISCWGRQSGKTTIGLHRLLYRPLQSTIVGPYWYVLQTHSASEIAFNRFWDLNRKSRVNAYGDLVRDRGLLREKPNESEKFATLINGSTCWFKSGQNFEDLRAETLLGAIIDEYRQQSPKLWPMVIRPMLARFKGWADILSTPNGFEHFKDLFYAAQTDPEWDTFHAPSSEAPWWTKEEVASARGEMDEDEFAQEILAEFREMGVGKVYKSHGEWNRLTQNPFAITGQFWSPHLPITVGLDFNVGLMCWELGQHKADEWYYGDELAVPNTNTAEVAPMLVEKVLGHAPGVELIGDASGKARKSSATENDYQIILKALREAGVRVTNKTPEANPPIRMRVNIMNALLKNAKNETRLWYNKTLCTSLGEDFQRVIWRQGTNELDFDKRDPKRTHAADAAGYPPAFFNREFKAKPGIVHVLVR